MHYFLLPLRSTQWIARGLYALEKIITFQLLIMSCSLPILVAWGLPMSIMTIPGNILLVPYIGVFLFVSVMHFLITILQLPNTLTALCINKLSALLVTMLDWSSPAWLIGFAAPPHIITIIVLGCSLYAIRKLAQSSWRPLYSALLVLLGNLLFYGLLTTFKQTTTNTIVIDEKITLTKTTTNTFILHTHGTNWRRRSAEKYAEYELIPSIMRKLGSCTIHGVKHHGSTRSWQPVIEYLVAAGVVRR